MEFSLKEFDGYRAEEAQIVQRYLAEPYEFRLRRMGDKLPVAMRSRHAIKILHPTFWQPNVAPKVGPHETNRYIGGDRHRHLNVLLRKTRPVEPLPLQIRIE